jgi:outer membrane protein assembly factor BamB
VTAPSQSSGRFLIALLALAAATSARSQDPPAPQWPAWRGPNCSGIAEDPAWRPNWPASPKILWKASVGKGFSSLAVADDRVYTMGNRDDVDSVFCLNARSGTVVWQHSYPCPLTPLSYDGGPSATPAVDGQRVYTLSKSGHAFCLDAMSGKVVWSKKFEPAPRKQGDYQVDWGYAASPLVLGEKLILSVGWAGAALNKSDGAVLWDNGPGRPGYSSPVPFQQGDRTLLAMLVARGVVAVDAENGRIAWTFPWRTTWDQNAPDVLAFDRKLFVSTGHNVGCALIDLAGGEPKELWRNKSMRNELSSSVFWKGRLYGFDNNRLACLDAATGKSLWSAPGMGRGTLILVNGHLIVLSESGKLSLAPATDQGFQPLGAAWEVLAGRCWTAPAFSRGLLFLRNSEGDVACVDLRSQ